MAKKKRKIETLEIGCLGINHFSGVISEEKLKDLRTLKDRVRIYSQMYYNDPIIAGNLNALESLILKSTWDIKAYSEKPRHKKEAEFAKKVVFGITNGFHSALNEALACIVYGFSDLEICYAKDPETGYYIWRDLSPRPAESIYQWLLDNNGKFLGLMQRNPKTSEIKTITADRLLHFAPKARKRNPEGVSLLRSCYQSWSYKSRIQEMEAIGVEKDVRGTPIAKAPSEYLDTKNPNNVEIQNQLKTLVSNLSRNEDAGIVFPSDEGWIIELMKGGGESQVRDTNIIVERHNRDMAISLLSDFVMLGKGASGSLADTKVKVFSSFVTYLMDSIQSVFNDGLKRLWEINGMDTAEMPIITHTNLEELETMVTALLLQSAHKLGLITPSAQLENYIRKHYLGKDVPEVTDEDWQKGREELIKLSGKGNQEDTSDKKGDNSTNGNS